MFKMAERNIQDNLENVVFDLHFCLSETVGSQHCDIFRRHLEERLHAWKVNCEVISKVFPLNPHILKLNKRMLRSLVV